MHIAVACHDLYPDPGSGGTGRYVYETTRRLADRGHDVSVVTRRRGDVPRAESIEDIDVGRYDLSVAETTAPSIAAQLPGAARSVAAHLPDDPDVLSFQGPVTAALAHAAADGETPRRCTFHSPWPTEYRLRTRRSDVSDARRRLNARVRDGIEGRLLNAADEIGTLSQYMGDRLESRYAPSPPSTVIPGGVDTDVFTPGAGGTDLGDGAGTTFLTVRRLSPRMGHGLLLDAFAAVNERRPETELLVAGDGPLADDLRARARELGVDDAATFLGYVPDEELPGTYADADVFVLPTTELEGFGLATLEALAAGTPVVGTPVGGTVELLEDLEASEPIPEPMLLPSVDVDALAARMQDWTTVDADALERAGDACRRYAGKRYTWDRTVDALERRYRRLVDGNGR